MEESKFAVTFWGVRGGYPMPGPSTVTYGGNTTCIEVEAGEQRIVIDGGTGIIKLGKKIVQEHYETGKPINLALLLTHTHHDHTQGFPFFVPTRHPASTLYMFGPMLVTENLAEVLDRALSPPVFPLGKEELYSKRTLEYAINGDTIVMPAFGEPPERYSLGQDPGPLPSEAIVIDVYHGYHHPKSGILFFRITYRGHSVVIATDTEGYIDIDRKLVDFAQDADLLIHDAEYDEHEYSEETVVRQGWGHSTWRMAANVAKAAEVKQLALTHHSPMHDDAYLESMLEKTRQIFPNSILAQEERTVHIL
jgi:phosphoribosyl 1,2-cyclic phosphodiesterase